MSALEENQTKQRQWQHDILNRVAMEREPHGGPQPGRAETTHAPEGGLLSKRVKGPSYS